MVFGLLFGSVFGREDLIPALWLHPLAHPIEVLAVPLIFAVGLLCLGQLLGGLGALWRGELARWLLVELGFLVLYLGIIVRLLWGPELDLGSRCSGPAGTWRGASWSIAACSGPWRRWDIWWRGPCRS